MLGVGVGADAWRLGPLCRLLEDRDLFLILDNASVPNMLCEWDESILGLRTTVTVHTRAALVNLRFFCGQRKLELTVASACNLLHTERLVGNFVLEVPVVVEVEGRLGLGLRIVVAQVCLV